MSIYLEYPKNDELYDGKSHKILPSTLHEFELNNKKYYILSYFDTNNNNLTFRKILLTKDNNDFIYRPIDNYIEFEKLIKTVTLNRLDTKILSSSIKLGTNINISDLTNKKINLLSNARKYLENIYEVYVVNGKERYIPKDIYEKYLNKKYTKSTILKIKNMDFVLVDYSCINDIRDISNNKLKTLHKYLSYINSEDLLTRYIPLCVYKRYLSRDYSDRELFIIDDNYYVLVDLDEVNYVDEISENPYITSYHTRFYNKYPRRVNEIKSKCK